MVYPETISTLALQTFELGHIGMPAAFDVTVTSVTLVAVGSAAHAAEIRNAPLTEGPGLGVDMCSHNLRNLW